MSYKYNAVESAIRETFHKYKVDRLDFGTVEADNLFSRDKIVKNIKNSAVFEWDRHYIYFDPTGVHKRHYFEEVDALIAKDSSPTVASRYIGGKYFLDKYLASLDNVDNYNYFDYVAYCEEHSKRVDDITGEQIAIPPIGKAGNQFSVAHNQLRTKYYFLYNHG